MPLDFMVSYGWILWLTLIIIFVIIELSTLEFTFLMLAVGSLGGLIARLFGAPWWAQILVAGVLSLLLLLTLRPKLLKALSRGGDPTPSNIDALIGLPGVIADDFSGKATHVKLSNGETWTAKLSNSNRPLIAGERVLVTEIDGTTAVVVPAERTIS
ncbi:MAG: NfeD family protein [Rhodoglobus sp.]